MRDRMERFVLLPFSAGCVSESSIDVAVQRQQQQQQSRRSKPPSADNHKSTSGTGNREEDEESLSSNESMKSSFRLSKPDISTGFHRLFKSFKSFSQLFGFPTDVKHVTHIGIDGSATTNNPVKGWEDLIAPELLPHLPSVSLRQFELSMAAQADADLVKDST
ncbi:CRIB domain-containing protein RIC4 [Citrus sinensis]|uniref:CRIB domain-containing protein RIC4 n=1 Tax=Citrus sinensis TaxID=2711 RepID=A0ACB8JPG8_CITSI|nr:CRIB domain-containing protein RIC4 [Citrus sinensis]